MFLLLWCLWWSYAHYVHFFNTFPPPPYQGRRLCDGRCLFICFTFRKIKFDLCRFCNNNKLIMINNINKSMHLSFYYGGVFNCGSPNTMQWRPLLAKGRTAAQIKHTSRAEKYFIFSFFPVFLWLISSTWCQQNVHSQLIYFQMGQKFYFMLKTNYEPPPKGERTDKYSKSRKKCIYFCR